MGDGPNRESRGFRREHGARTLFVMMTFPKEPTTSQRVRNKNRRLDALFRIACECADLYGVKALRADVKIVSRKGAMWENIEIYMQGCSYGLAIADAIFDDGFNVNVAMETGYMLALGKRVCVIRDPAIRKMPSDIACLLSHPCDLSNIRAFRRSLEEWLAVDLGLPQQGRRPRR